jgi:AraC-like DNA-binding protein
MEKAKKWMTYNERCLNERALRLGYSSPQQRSNPFKRVMGMGLFQIKKALHRRLRDNLPGKTQ